MGKQLLISVRRVVSFALILVLIVSFCSTAICAQETFAVLPIIIDDTNYYVDTQFIGDTLYCRADQWAQAANCLWKLNPDQKTVYFYYETPVILTSYNEQVYIVDGNTVWVPFFESATATGVYFTEVSGDAVHGHRAKPLAVFYKDMDRMFAVSNYRVTELILSLGGAWVVASSASRSYAILSSMSISGFVDAIS